jgi:hypothetical protein
MKIEGINSLQAKLAALLKNKENVAPENVVVGYAGVNYAIYVHENLEAAHSPGKQAKFLESPARTLNNTGQLGKIVEKTVAKGGTVQQGLLLAGMAVQRASQKIVPIDTGNLRASAFTALESQVNQKSSQAAGEGAAVKTKTQIKRAKKGKKK